MRSTFKVGIVLGMLGSVALFANSSEYVTTQEKALGNSLTGSSLANDSLYTNPASSAFMSVYSVDGSFQLPRSFAISVLDTKTSSVGGALGYYRKKISNSSEALQGAKLSLSSKITEAIGVGIAGKMLWGPTTTLDSKGKFEKDKFNNIDLGILANTGY